MVCIMVQEMARIGENWSVKQKNWYVFFFKFSIKTHLQHSLIPMLSSKEIINHASI
jgi:hypothetical protein